MYGMTRRDLMAALATMLPAATLGGCGGMSDSASYRFRMTVEVATPQGVRTGSSVIQVEVQRTSPIGDRSGVNSGIRGEAVVIDLPDGPVFVLLKLPDAKGSLQGVATDALAGGGAADADGAMRRYQKITSSWFGLSADLPRDQWPMFVRFRDIADPKSVERVEPQAVGVTRIRVQTTHDAVTTGIRKRLGWLSDGGFTLDPGGGIDFSGNPPLAKQIYQREFTSEIER